MDKNAIVITFLGTLSIYDAPTERNKVIVEICNKDNVCHNLLVPNDQLNSKEVENWIIERHNNEK